MLHNTKFLSLWDKDPCLCISHVWFSLCDKDLHELLTNYSESTDDSVDSEFECLGQQFWNYFIKLLILYINIYQNFRPYVLFRVALGYWLDKLIAWGPIIQEIEKSYYIRLSVSACPRQLPPHRKHLSHAQHDIRHQWHRPCNLCSGKAHLQEF